MKGLLNTIAILSTTAIFAIIGFSEEGSRAPSSVVSTSKSGSAPKYQKTTSLDFDAADVDGDNLSPDSSAVSGEDSLYFDSMIESPNNFQRNLRRSSGAIR